MIRWSTNVRYRGPVFSGEAAREVDRTLNDVVRDVGELGGDLVRLDFDKVHRRPTGHARSKVAVSHEPGPRSRVGDGGIVYGPWLEGVGSRNKTTRFKGYATFRRIGQLLDVRAGLMAGDAFVRLVRRLNGGG